MPDRPLWQQHGAKRGRRGKHDPLNLPPNLKRPIRIGRLHYVGVEKLPEDFGDMLRIVQQVRGDRLEELADHLKVRGKRVLRYHELAMKLAIAFVPGFQIKPVSQKPGRPRSRWGPDQYAELAFWYQHYREKYTEKRRFDYWVCSEIFKKRSIIGLDKKVFSIAALRKQLRLLKESPGRFQMAVEIYKIRSQIQVMNS